MKVIVAKVAVQAGKEAEFEAAALELAAKVEAEEPGNQFYKLCRSDDGGYMFVELYDDEEAMAAHGASAHMKEAGPKFFAVMAGRPEITVLDVVEQPGD